MPAVAEFPVVESDRASNASPETIVDYYLRAQSELTAVERFSQHYEATELPLQARYYSSLLPAAPPGPGEQYAFDVELDACSGCKACVTACHSLNGLDEDETWRDVGLLHGGSEAEPFLQHVTAACHHCLEPACLAGCPVKAYEKDPATGIVRHLDDQCIGCQYCILACPYDVPKYSASRGIVRKCDMCSQRLAAGEAPACVQACPNSAIRITVVRAHEVVDNCEAGSFLPGAPDPHHTQPTTNYRTRRAFPRNVLPADYYAVHAEHAHWPLIIMLVLTQLSVGAFAVQLILDRMGAPEVVAAVRGVHAAGGLSFGLLALAASTLHLGRPQYAFRAVIGLATSWLSREILAFGLFAGLASVYAAAVWWAQIDGRIETALSASVVAAGLAGVWCSIMIYHHTKRPLWHGTTTSARFLLTVVVLGAATVLSASLMFAAASGTVSTADIFADHAGALVRTLVGATMIKLIFEAGTLLHARDRQHTPLKRSALLMLGDLAKPTAWRFVLGLTGGVVLPAALLAARTPAPATAAVVALALLATTLAGEILERYLFFTAVAAARMPGGLRT